MTKLYKYIENLGLIEKDESECTLTNFWYKTKEEAYFNHLANKINKHKEKIENLENQLEKERVELNKAIEIINKMLEENPEFCI